MPSASGGGSAIDPHRRRAALIATAVTLPLVVIVALIIGSVTGSGTSDSGSGPATSGAPLPAVTVSPPPSDAASVQPCTKVLEGLPVRLNGLDPRVVVSNPSSPFVVGWGDPPVILRCGVARPKDLHPGSSAQFIQSGPPSGTGTVYFDVTAGHGANVYTSVDRAVYIEITIPAKYASAPLPALAGVIAKALPAVCVGGVTPGRQVDPSKLCAERK